ncbi:hypothetical protein DFJ73DRAFT_829889 [Zopfochytrium polystomum]|nr:hypothetical protein DFJ73DRAFT_829889 [Zopfochytrium polystomum]
MLLHVALSKILLPTSSANTIGQKMRKLSHFAASGVALWHRRKRGFPTLSHSANCSRVASWPTSTGAPARNFLKALTTRA